MKPGIYDDLPCADYREIEAINASSLAEVDRSPRHWKFFRDNPSPPTKAMEFGTAFHEMVLEPDEFSKHYVVNPHGNWRTKDSREFKAAMEAQGKIALNDNDATTPWEYGEYGRLLKMADAVKMSQEAMTLLAGKKELTIVWRDPDFDLLCKGRIDCRNEPRNLLVDLKSSRNAAEDDFRQSVRTFGYASQAAMYLDGWSDLTGNDAAGFCFVVAEKEPPFALSIYQIDNEFISYGRDIYKRRLAKLQQCFQTDVWPSYPDEVRTLSLYQKGLA